MEPNDTNSSDVPLREQLRDYFGDRTFRPGQTKAMDSALKGRDTLVVIPTGSGKSRLRVKAVVERRRSSR